MFLSDALAGNCLLFGVFERMEYIKGFERKSMNFYDISFFCFRFEQILLDQDPLPSYGLKLLLALLEQNTSFIKQFEELGLVSVIFQVLLVC